MTKYTLMEKVQKRKVRPGSHIEHTTTGRYLGEVQACYGTIVRYVHPETFEQGIAGYTEIRTVKK
jgi:hypothetical protein